MNTETVNISQKTGTWYYSSTLLKNNKLVNSGKNQYILVQWLNENNENIIKNDFIPSKSSIKILAKKNDFISIFCKELSINKDTQEYYDLFEEKEENIIIIGTQQHRGGAFFTSQLISGGILGNDVSPYNKMMFVHQALREVRLCQDKTWTILLCTGGYSSTQIKKIKDAFNDKEVMNGCVSNIIDIADNDLESIINYINLADVKKETEIKKREFIKISHISIYSHGLPDGIYLWMDDIWPYQKAFDSDEILKLKESAFSWNSQIYCYSCRTGIGSNSEDFTNGKETNCKRSIAQKIANATGATVHAYQTRTSYEDTLVKPEYRKRIEALYSKSDDIPNYQLLREIWNENTYKVDGAIFYPKGAFNPVKADTSPKGLPNTMVIYTR